MAHEGHEVGEHFAAAFYLLTLHRLEGTPELGGRGGERWERERLAQLPQVLERKFQRPGAGIDDLQGGQFALCSSIQTRKSLTFVCAFSTAEASKPE